LPLVKAVTLIEPYNSNKEPYILTEEPSIPTKEPYTSRKEPYLPTKEPYILTKRSPQSQQEIETLFQENNPIF